jgi:hypothetical protein
MWRDLVVHPGLDALIHLDPDPIDAQPELWMHQPETLDTPHLEGLDATPGLDVPSRHRCITRV